MIGILFQSRVGLGCVDQSRCFCRIKALESFFLALPANCEFFFFGLGKPGNLVDPEFRAHSFPSQSVGEFPLKCIANTFFLKRGKTKCCLFPFTTAVGKFETGLLR